MRYYRQRNSTLSSIIPSCKDVFDLFKPKISILVIPDTALRSYLSQCYENAKNPKEAALYLAYAKLDTLSTFTSRKIKELCMDCNMIAEAMMASGKAK